jgi:hypothetical protein
LKNKHNGRDICYKYNNNLADDACNGKCGRLHICQICLKEDCCTKNHR